MNIVLFQPEIPMNTGNIGRTCVATGSKLHLIRPLGFEISDKYLKRASLDYWQHLDVFFYDDFQHFLNVNNNPKIFMVSTKARNLYSDFSFSPNDFFMFGKESAGIPEDILLKYKDTCIRIPMLCQYRSLNLSNAVSIVLFEALRQNNFFNLSLKGDLHFNSWD